MELHRMHKTFQHGHLGEEKHQMLNLNQRLETYLSRVKLLEEENALLTKEIQTQRCSSHEGLKWRKGLEEELRQGRLAVDAAWRDMVHTELEVGRLAEELQALDLQREREAQAHAKAKMKLEKSRKELEEEQRAQIWLREKVSQLEHEMRHLIQTHQEDVAHLEASLAHSRAAMPPTLALRGNQTPNLLQLGQEFSQRASRAWQEAAQAYQGQLVRLEESLNQARSQLTQLGQEKRESQLKLQALEKDIASAKDVRWHLERTAAQQGQKYSQEIQQLQEHLESLEGEKEELGQQIDRVVQENRGLLQVKMSLGLEVATYRALLDSESLRGHNSLFKQQPRNISITATQTSVEGNEDQYPPISVERPLRTYILMMLWGDAVFSPQAVKKNYPTQLSVSRKTTSLSSVCDMTGSRPKAITSTPIWNRKPETPKIFIKPAHEDTKSATLETPYPKILQDGAVENFRPQEVHERVTYAEPLSPPNEQEALAESSTAEDKEGEADWNDVGVKPPEERPVVESIVSYKAHSGLSTEPVFNKEVNQHQFAEPNLTLDRVRMTEEPCGFSDEPNKDEPFQGFAEKGDMQDCDHKQVERVREETSDSETEAVLEPNFESRTSSPVSEYEPEESVFNKVTDFSQDEKILKEDAVEIREESSIVGTNEPDVEDKLYPDGEEMDTWDSVIERKVDPQREGREVDNEKQQRAEPEEDISTREREHEKKEIRPDSATYVQQDDKMASSKVDTQVDDEGQCAALIQEHAPPPDLEGDDEEEDSQNVSVSWRTELESDSYAQDNTLADTRPLIRYKSDETDANTQVSHMDESESSEEEQEKKVGETGTEMWSEGKSKRSGTMEDLCEEVEEEAMDEEYDIEYTHTENTGVVYMTASEQVDDPEDADESIEKVSKEHFEEDTEELSKPMVPTNVAYDEELETDRLVEQELENLATDSYSSHFAKQQVSEREKLFHLQSKSVEEITEQGDAGKTIKEDKSPSVRGNHELTSSTTIINQPYENLHLRDMPDEELQTDTLADEGVQHEDQGALEKREEEDEHNVSMVTHADITEDHPNVSDLISRPDMEESINLGEPNFMLRIPADQETLQNVSAPTEVKEVVPMTPSSASQEHLVEDDADCQEFPCVQETTDWEVRENPTADFKIQDLSKESEPESYPHYDGGSNEGVTTHKEESLEISPDSVPDENDIFAVKDSKLLDTNSKDSNLHGLFSSGLKNDFWVSSLETGATYQPDDANNEAAEQTDQDLGFADNLDWGELENPNVVNWRSRMDFDSSKGLATKKEQEQIHSEMKQPLCKNVVEGEFVHSEESEVEGESWSSGEDAV